MYRGFKTAASEALRNEYVGPADHRRAHQHLAHRGGALFFAEALFRKPRKWHREAGSAHLSSDLETSARARIIMLPRLQCDARMRTLRTKEYR